MKKSSAKKRRRTKAVDTVTRSSGNVFADLGLADADTLLAKAQLANAIIESVRADGLNQKQAAERLGIDQPKVSSLMRGKLQDFSTERLMRFLTALNRDVVISIREPKGRANVRVKIGA